MFPILFLASFIAVPLIEIVLFIQVGKAIGAGPTILLTLLTSALGIWFVRQHGISTALKARETMNAGGLPVKEMFSNACVTFGGLLLILPGFFTDTLGLLLFLPPVQALLLDWLKNHSSLKVDLSQAGGQAYWNNGADSPTGRASGGTVIDGEFTEVNDDNPSAKSHDGRTTGNNPWGQLDGTTSSKNTGDADK